MRFAGIDIGSRSIELIVLQDQEVVVSKQAASGFEPLIRAKVLLDKVSYDGIVATGYGRNLFQIFINGPTVTEIKAYARGARHLFPNCRTILDIGGQDIKVIAVNDQGKVTKFEMNDKCAAGTGKFLEILAHALGYELDEFGPEALRASKMIEISSMCTVFAETEITSLVARGEDRRDIARGVHRAIVRRAVSMLKRITPNGSIVFAGGAAKNSCLKVLLEKSLAQEVQVPENPEFVGALGAAILAEELSNFR